MTDVTHATTNDARPNQITPPRLASTTLAILVLTQSLVLFLFLSSFSFSCASLTSSLALARFRLDLVSHHHHHRSQRLSGHHRQRLTLSSEATSAQTSTCDALSHS